VRFPERAANVNRLAGIDGWMRDPQRDRMIRTRSAVIQNVMSNV
jgi:hypothetical protein